jgi:hypothetical protein
MRCKCAHLSTAYYLQPSSMMPLFITFPKCSTPLCSCILYSGLNISNFLKTVPGFPYNLLKGSCGDIGFKKEKCRSSFDLVIRPQSAFTAFRAIFHSTYCWVI